MLNRLSELPGFLDRYGKSIRLKIDSSPELSGEEVLVLGEEKIIDNTEKEEKEGKKVETKEKK